MITILSISILAILSVAIAVNARWIITEMRYLFFNKKLLYFGWAIMFLGIAVFSGREVIADTVISLDSSSKFQLMYMFIGGIISITLLLHSNSLSCLFLVPIVYLIVYGLFGVITSIFSPVPMLSVYKATLILVDASFVATAIALALRDKETGIKLVNLTYLLVGLFVVGSILGIILLPNLALLPSYGLFSVILAGAFPHMNPNELGFLAAIISVVALRRMLSAENLKQKILWASILLSGLFVVLLAQSRTAVAALFIAIVFIFWSIPKYRKLSVLSAFFLFLSLLFMASVTDLSKVGAIDTGITYLQRGQDEGGLKTIKGRSSAWVNVGWSMFLDKPLIGHGFDAGVRYGGAEYGIGKTHMHNSYVQVLSNSGLFGIIPWLLMMLAVILMSKRQLFKYHWPVKNKNDLIQLEIASVLIIVFLRSVTGSVLVVHSWSLMVFLSIMAFLMIAKKQQLQKKVGCFVRSDKDVTTDKRILRRKKKRNILKT